MKSTATSTSGCVSSPCESSKLERPRYFPRQLITPEELNLEQRYFRDRMRRHNRLLHGWGVVCGAQVCPVPSAEAKSEAANGNSNGYADDDCSPCPGWEPWKVIVTPGYILGPYGDEIMISSRVCVDLRRPCTPSVAGDCWSSGSDPWCSDMELPPVEGPVYIAVKYEETKTRPVRVPPPGCGCNDMDCDFSRWCDGFEICSLSECPESHRTPPMEQPVHLPDCPACPEEPWVVLACVDFDPKTGCITSIDNCACRRQVRSYACYWWKCEDPAQTIQPRPERERQGIRHVGGGYYEVRGHSGRVRSERRAREVARAIAEGHDPHEIDR